jgi:hypothetical protein
MAIGRHCWRTIACPAAPGRALRRRCSLARPRAMESLASPTFCNLTMRVTQWSALVSFTLTASATCRLVSSPTRGRAPLPRLPWPASHHPTSSSTPNKHRTQNPTTISHFTLLRTQKPKTTTHLNALRRSATNQEIQNQKRQQMRPKPKRPQTDELFRSLSTVAM